jgi:hypothetical protein
MPGTAGYCVDTWRRCDPFSHLGSCFPVKYPPMLRPTGTLVESVQTEPAELATR